MCIILSRALIHLPACSTIAWLYVYDCICMIVCVRLYDNVRMMLSWRSQDHIQLVKTCNRQWLRVYEFMLVACRRFMNNLVNSRTEWWTQKCAKWTLAPYVFVLLLMGMRHVPVCGIIAWLYVYALYLYDCMCMMVWRCAHDVMMTSTRSYTVSSSVSSNMIAFVSIHVGWDTWWGSGRFQCIVPADDMGVVGHTQKTQTPMSSAKWKKQKNA